MATKTYSAEEYYEQLVKDTKNYQSILWYYQNLLK